MWHFLSYCTLSMPHTFVNFNGPNSANALLWNHGMNLNLPGGEVCTELGHSLSGTTISLQGALWAPDSDLFLFSSPLPLKSWMHLLTKQTDFVIASTDNIVTNFRLVASVDRYCYNNSQRNFVKINWPQTLNRKFRPNLAQGLDPKLLLWCQSGCFVCRWIQGLSFM